MAEERQGVFRQPASPRDGQRPADARSCSARSTCCRFTGQRSWRDELSV